MVAHGRIWTGTDGVYLADQLQYMAWIRVASTHVLVSNLFVLHPTPADYFQLPIALSGGLAALGVPVWLALLAWKPVALLACFFVFRRYVALSLTGRWPRLAALILALCFGSFTVVYGTAGVIGDLMPVFLSWGYVFALLAVAALGAALMSYGRARDEGRLPWTAAALGAVASLIHPWQGELLVVIVLGSEAVLRIRGKRAGCPPQGSRPCLKAPALAVTATLLPLAYYAALGRLDLSWRLARVASKHAFPLWAVLLALLPLALASLLAWPQRPPGFLATATRMWPLASIAIYAVSSTSLGATPLHAFQGVTLPLAVLAVAGSKDATRGLLLRRLVAAVAVAAFTVPATVSLLDNARSLVASRSGSARFIAAGESRALDYLRTDRRRGGVLARSYLGALIPSATGRHTFVGDCLWSEPNCSGRMVAVHELFEGLLRPSAARAIVQSTRARFLLADCRPGADLRRVLGALVATTRQFGCARLYVLRDAGAADAAGPSRLSHRV